MLKTLGKFGLPIIALGMLCFGLFHMLKAQPHLPETPPPALPARSPHGAGIAAAGIVEPESETIALGTALPGVVLEVFVPVNKVGQKVKAGDPLFRVDDRHLQAQLAFQKANLAAKMADLARLQSQPRQEEIPPQEAKVKAAEANAKIQEDRYRRAARLVQTKAVTQEEFVGAELTMESSRAQLDQAQAELRLLKAGAWEPDKRTAQAAVALAQAQLDQTKIEIERTWVRAPTDGEVLQVNVRPGEFVGAQAGSPLVMLGDTGRPYVRIDIDEHDIPRYHRGAPAQAFIRGDAAHEQPLHFVRVEPFVIPKKALTGENTERVDTRVLQVIYAFDSPVTNIYVGQQVDIVFDGRAEMERVARSQP